MPNKGVIILHFPVRRHKCTRYASVPQRRKTYTEKQAGTMTEHPTNLFIEMSPSDYRNH